MDAHVSCVSIILNELGEQVSSTLHLGECTLLQFNSVCEHDRWACQLDVMYHEYTDCLNNELSIHQCLFTVLPEIFARVLFSLNFAVGLGPRKLSARNFLHTRCDFLDAMELFLCSSFSFLDNS